MILGGIEMKFLLLILLLVACNQTSSPADAVKKSLDGLKRLDPVVLSQLAGGKDVLKDTPAQAQTILKNALQKLEYEILNTETKNNQARVTVNLKVVEVGKMADLAMKSAQTKLGENASKEFSDLPDWLPGKSIGHAVLVARQPQRQQGNQHEHDVARDVLQGDGGAVDDEIDFRLPCRT